jgi:hypothetical protein
MDRPNRRESSDAPSNEVVVADLKCISCDYNLKTLDVGERCPECGESVERSLVFLPHPKMTAGAVKLTAWSLIVQIFDVTCAPFSLVGHVVMATIAAHRLNSRCDLNHIWGLGARIRWWRITLIAEIVAGAFATIGAIVLPRSPLWDIYFWICLPVALVAYLASNVMSLLVCRRLADHVNQTKLTKDFRTILWLLAAAWCGIAVFILVDLTVPSSEIELFFGLPVILVGLTVTVWRIVCTFKLSSPLVHAPSQRSDVAALPEDPNPA